MQSLLIIIVKSILASGMLFGYYCLMLRNRKFHQYNRVYLLAAVVISLIIPFVSLPFDLLVNSPVRQLAFRNFEFSQEDEAVVIEATGGPFSIPVLLFLTYLLVSFIFLFLLCRSFLHIRRMCRNNPSEKLNGLRIYYTNEDGTPFSFFRKIFWNNSLSLHSREGAQVLQHELYHVRQHHGADMLFMHLLQVIAWFNPFYYLIRKELQAIHEFLADQYALEEQEHLAYAEMLVQQSIRAKRLHISNHFFQQQIKRRITMIINKPLKQPGYFSRILAIPVIILFSIVVVSFAHRQPEYNVEHMQAATGNHQASQITRLDTIMPMYPGGASAWQNFLNKTLYYPQKAIDGEIKGTVTVKFIINEDGTLENITAMNDPGGGLAEEAIRLIKASGKWQPATLGGKPIKVQFQKPITFALEIQ